MTHNPNKDRTTTPPKGGDKLIDARRVSLNIFVNKELSDSIRDVMLNSPINLDQAILLLENSNDYNRDSFAMKKMSLIGMDFGVISNVIKALNS